MKDKINRILSEVKTKISEAANENELQNVKSASVGKQGSLTLLMKEIPTLDVSLRPEMGKLLNQAKKEVTELIDEKVASMSCKAAVKGNNRLSAQEVNALIGELLTLDNPYHCPHGRPTIIAMTKRELEKKFKRIV